MNRRQRMTSIFAIYAEKFGFVGTTILLLIFGFFFTRIKSIAERLPDNFSRLLVIGVLAWFSTQALINIGGMVGLLPLKGITLPFISYGGQVLCSPQLLLVLSFRPRNILLTQLLGQKPMKVLRLWGEIFAITLCGGLSIDHCTYRWRFRRSYHTYFGCCC